MPADVQSLVEEGKCYECYGPLTLGQLLTITLLSRIVKTYNPVADTSPQTLLDRGNCLACYGLSVAEIFTLVLLDMINVSASAGGSGGAGKNGNGSPVGVVTPDFINQDYRDDTGVPFPQIWQSTGLTSADWVKLT